MAIGDFAHLTSLRSTIVLLILALAGDAGIDLQNLDGGDALLCSVSRISIQWHVCNSAEALVLENAKLCSRGSIRKSHDVYSWLDVLCELRSKGATPSMVIKRWDLSGQHCNPPIALEGIALPIASRFFYFQVSRDTPKGGVSRNNVVKMF